MSEIKNEQTESVTSQPAAADEVLGETDNAKVSFGKFKDAEALLSAYNSLQAEFTKRCQRLKELEREGEELKAKLNAPINATPQGEGITLKEKEEILKDYLSELVEAKTKAIVLSGGGALHSSPALKPKTIAEAGSLTKDFFK